MKTYGTFADAIQDSIWKLLGIGSDVQPNNWQSMGVSQLKAAQMKELLFHSIKVMMPKGIEGLRNEIHPNLPWADEHFELERVSREPINPGETWREWPWSNSANTFRKDESQFDHSYAERYWPRFAGYTHDGHVDDKHKNVFNERVGVRNRVGDLDDIVERLHTDNMTRQAVLSVWHPEDQVDTGKRVPCSLTYQFINRGNHIHVIYNIRSCDAFRHFRDDLYLTARLLLWVIVELQLKDATRYHELKPGFFVMNIGSFHCFINDIPHLEKWL
jgi:thymidylate synthase